MMLAAYLGLLFSVFVWGSNFIAGDWLVQKMDPVWIAATRLLFSSTFLILAGLLMRKFTRLNKGQFGLLLLSGLVGTLVNQTCFYSAVHYISPTQSALIMSLAPVATAILSFFLLREKISLPVAVGSVIAIAGVFLLATDGSGFQMNVGDAFSAGAMLTFSLNMVFIRKLSKGLNAIPITLFSTVLGTGLFYPAAWVTQGTPHYLHTLVFWVVLISSAVLSQGLCGLLMNYAIKKIGATQVAITSNLQPFIAMLVGYLVLRIPVTTMQIVGGLVILLGIICTMVRLKKRQQNVTPSVSV